MHLTLWRGEQLLGELRQQPTTSNSTPPQADRPQSLLAFLIPSVQAPALRGVWQIELIFLGSVAQVLIEPDIVAERSRRTRGPSSGALEPISPDAIVPVEMQLTVRDESGRTILPRQILLEEVRYRPEEYEAALREAPPEALVNGSVWSVYIVFASDADSPAT